MSCQLRPNAKMIGIVLHLLLVMVTPLALRFGKDQIVLVSVSTRISVPAKLAIRTNVATRFVKVEVAAMMVVVAPVGSVPIRRSVSTASVFANHIAMAKTVAPMVAVEAVACVVGKTRVSSTNVFVSQIVPVRIVGLMAVVVFVEFVPAKVNVFPTIVSASPSVVTKSVVMMGVAEFVAPVLGQTVSVMRVNASVHLIALIENAVTMVAEALAVGAM